MGDAMRVVLEARSCRLMQKETPPVCSRRRFVVAMA
jgi:hypothetical protein